MHTPLYHFFAAADLVIVGQHPEMADYSNPRGDVIRAAAYVVAEDALGNRVCSDTIDTGFEDEVLPAAQRLAARLNARLQNLGKLPIGFVLWREGRPAYGSEAYDGAEDAMLERMEDAESTWRCV